MYLIVVKKARRTLIKYLQKTVLAEKRMIGVLCKYLISSFQSVFSITEFCGSHLKTERHFN